MFFDAFKSASSLWPHFWQQKCKPFRFDAETYPHFGQALDVLRGLTASTSIPTAAALYAILNRISA
jgi:hypothetical protein